MKGNLKMRKKLNNKGFTLIELLAVIVILAIVVAITIPAVLSSINGARTSAFETTAKTVADWVEREYQAYLVGDTKVQKVDASFVDDVNGSGVCYGKISKDGNGGECLTQTTGATTSDAVKKFLKAAGVNPDNYTSVAVKIENNGRACIELWASTTGDYKNNTASVKSPGCN